MNAPHSGKPASLEVSVRPWSENDLTLLKRMNTAEMWAHLGGPESEEAVASRHQRYMKAVPGRVRMFTILFGDEAVGNVGYWAQQWRDQDVFEVGWGVLPEFQGHGIAMTATSAMLDILRDDVPNAIVYAFPGVSNFPSNAICRKLGFSLAGETEVEFPKGSWMKSNEWRLEFPG
ncbi:GNAT family N-acetyltransferase [Paenibacillus sp. GbtcB18]|uniref:GNAT family N-acetyltransferase n=1 Tax=Paenibacillus sp. GbtcB18 TaxID=2824763 RepID=UPI001C2F7533|nr:GNAT family N-acetyltransferase [Paenibacillus sp. GbtcB18]